jgi:hypothetical protein
LLNLHVREHSVRANAAVVDERAPANNNGTVAYWDVWIFKPPEAVTVSKPVGASTGLNEVVAKLSETTLL